MLSLPMVSVGFRLSGVAVGSGRQVVVAYINIGSYYLVGIPFGILLGWLLPSGIVVTFVTLIFHSILAKVKSNLNTMAMPF